MTKPEHFFQPQGEHGDRCAECGGMLWLLRHFGGRYELGEAISRYRDKASALVREERDPVIRANLLDLFREALRPKPAPVPRFKTTEEAQEWLDARS